MFRKILMFIMLSLHQQPQQRCRLYTRNHFREPAPIVIRNGQLLEPTDKFGNVELNYGESLTLSCEGGGSIHHPNMARNVITATISCEEGEKFQNPDWLNGIANFSDFRCGNSPPHSSRRTDRRCYDGNIIIEVGYIVENEFYASYESCFDQARCNAVYSKHTQKPYNHYFQQRVSKHTQKPYNNYFQQRVNRPFFVDHNHYGRTPVNELFSPRSLRSSVEELVGPMIDRYFTKTNYLNRGHLAAKTDFVFAFGERASFHYVNCAPQWYAFNGGNWNTLEVDLRQHIHEAEYDTIIYTGTFGVTQLFNQYGRKVDIYLFTDENNNPVLPVPLYYYKVVYEPSSLKGIVFVGINNPYCSLQEFEDLTFCQDVCGNDRRFSWLTWDPEDAEEGYSFCCTVDSFRQTVPHLPDFEVQSLLT